MTRNDFINLLKAEFGEDEEVILACDGELFYVDGMEYSVEVNMRVVSLTSYEDSLDGEKFDDDFDGKELDL